MTGPDYARAFHPRLCQFGFGAAFCPRSGIAESECGQQMQRGRFGYLFGNADPYAQVVVFDTGFGVSPVYWLLVTSTSPSTSQHPPPRTGF